LSSPFWIGLIPGKSKAQALQSRAIHSAKCHHDLQIQIQGSGGLDLFA
jgi:hypothetical protein